MRKISIIIIAFVENVVQTDAAEIVSHRPRVVSGVVVRQLEYQVVFVLFNVRTARHAFIYTFRIAIAFRTAIDKHTGILLNLVRPISALLPLGPGLDNGFVNVATPGVDGVGDFLRDILRVVVPVADRIVMEVAE